MTDLSNSHLLLFAKLSKILAQTFEDIHKICLKQSERQEKNFNTKKLQKKRSLQKREQNKFRDEGNDIIQNKLDAEQDQSKPPKPKKIKLRGTLNQTNGNKLKRQQKKKKIAKWQQQGKPRPPLNAFMLFLRDSKFEIMEAKPQLTPSQVSAYASALWNQLTQDQKQKYRSQYRQNRVKYDEELKLYHEKQKINGRLPIKTKKGMQKTDKIEKDILDKDLVNVNDSDISQSISGI